MTSLWVKFLKDHASALAVVLILYNEGPLDITKIANMAEKVSPALKSMNPGAVTRDCQWLREQELITLEGERPIIADLDAKGRSLATILVRLERFILTEVGP